MFIVGSSVIVFIVASVSTVIGLLIFSTASKSFTSSSKPAIPFVSTNASRFMASPSRSFNLSNTLTLASMFFSSVKIANCISGLMSLPDIISINFWNTPGSCDVTVVSIIDLSIATSLSVFPENISNNFIAAGILNCPPKTAVLI